MKRAVIKILARFPLVKSPTKGLNALYNPFRERTPNPETPRPELQTVRQFGVTTPLESSAQTEVDGGNGHSSIETPGGGFGPPGAT